MVEDSHKKFAVGDMPPSPTISTTTLHKKPTRHHVKRRSSGRIHVTKLAPLARAHIQQQQQPATEDEDIDQDQQHVPRKPMKRSHSSKSIQRLSSNDPQRKANLSGFTMTAKPTTTTTTTTTPLGNDSPPVTPIEQQPLQRYDPPSSGLPRKKEQPPPVVIASPTIQVSHQSTAAPVAHIMTATANPNPTTAAPKATSDCPPLHSEFIDRPSSPLYQQPPLSNDDIAQRSIVTVTHEYQAIRTFHDPMMASLARCMHQQQKQALSIVPTSAPPQQSHTRQRHQRLLQLSPLTTTTMLDSPGWSASAFLDRVFYGIS